MKSIYFYLLILLFFATSVQPDSHSLLVISIYIRGETPFPEFSFSLMLDDIPVGYYDSEEKIFFSRGLKKGEDDDGVVDPNNVKLISNFILANHEERYEYMINDLNITEKIHVQQRLIMCELLDNDKPGQMITKNGFCGTTQDELRLHEDKFTYSNGLNFTEDRLKPHLDLSKWRHKDLYYPACIKTLRNLLKKRSNQVKRKVKPRVRIVHKRRPVSDWDGVTCLATGFYPRHINLTMFWNGRLVPEHRITGGELLPNVDGTYQMRKNLELTEEELKQKHNYTCTATHLSLDNKLHVHLDFDPGEPIMSIVTSVLVTLVFVGLLLVFVTIGVIWIFCRRKQTAPSHTKYSSASTTEENEMDNFGG